jgi:branched-chain amino acid transport system ATP-binding protein
VLSKLKELVAPRDGTRTHKVSGQTTAEPAKKRRLLELEDISVHYLHGAIKALDVVSLGLDEGEIVAVMGPNGAGKSTVLKAILGLAPVVGGRVYWKQKELQAAVHEVVQFGIAFVPQGRRVFTYLTIEENLEMGCLYLKDKAEKRRRMEQVMDIFPVLHEKRRDKASAMSGGEQQMLAVGRGLMASPEVLLLDEPTLGLAPKIVKEMFQKVVEINEKQGTSIFVVEHNIKSTLDIVNRAYVLNYGKVVHDGTPQSVRETDILTQVFLGGGPVPDANQDASGSTSGATKSSP